MDEALERCIKLIDEMQAEIDRLQEENLWLLNDRKRLILVNALRAPVQKRPQGRPKKKTENDSFASNTTKKKGAPNKESLQVLYDNLPDMVNEYKLKHGVKTNKAALRIIYKESNPTCPIYVIEKKVTKLEKILSAAKNPVRNKRLK